MMLPYRRPDERFFLSRCQPFVVWCLNLLVLRLTLWGPWPFLSLAVGWMWRDRPWAFQVYLGIKCDGTETGKLWTTHPGEYVMVLTPKELAAFRVHTISKELEWTNQAGA